MTKLAEQFLEQWKSLDEADRADVVDELSVILEPSDDPEYIAAWETEIRTRIEQVERGEIQPIPWREAIELICRGEGDDE